MLGHSHLVMGIASWTAVGTMMGYPIDLPSVVCAAVGGLLPDIDHPRSMINRQFKPLKLIGKWVPHRGPTHSLLFIVGLIALLMWLDMKVDDLYRPWMIALGTGAISHLVTDWMTRGGIPVFWPAPVRFRMPGAFLTGSWQEKACVSLAITGMIIYFTQAYKHPWAQAGIESVTNGWSSAITYFGGLIS